MAEIRIAVPAGIIAPGGPFFEVVLKHPSLDDYFDLGEIVTWGKAPDGTVFTVQNGEVLRAYLSRCLVQPKDPLLLNQGGFTLARQLRNAILDFFRDGDSATAPSPTSPTTSSSDAAKDGSPPTPLAA